MQDNKEELTQHASNTSPPSERNYDHHATKPSFGQRVKRHYRRFWWLHLIIIIVVVLVVTLPLVYVGFPNIAQSQINKGKINVTSMAILNPAPDSFDLELTSVLETSSKYHPKLDGWNGSLTLDGSDSPFIYLNVPPTPGDNGAVSNVNQSVTIVDQDEFTKYTTASLKQETVITHLDGRGGLHEGGLPSTNVNYRKTITMAGFNSLKGFNVTSLQILTTAQPDGTNTLGTVYIPNPSVQTIQMGNVTMSLSVAGTPIGTSRIENMILKPGNNTFDMKSTTNTTAVVQLFLFKYKSGIFPVDIVTNSSVFNGQDLPYFTSALQANPLTVQLNIKAAIIASGLGKFLGLPSPSSSSATTSGTAVARP